MNRNLNLQLKNGVEPKELLKYGFKPKYDENTGEIIEYNREIVIEADRKPKWHFTFVIHKYAGRKLFKRFEYDAWLSGFNWCDVTTTECMQMLYDLIINGIVEPAETVVEHIES